MALKKWAACFMVIVLFVLGGCKQSDDSSDSGSTDTTSVTKNTDGTTTLALQENGSGFISTTGNVKTTDTSMIGWTGSGYIDTLSTGSSVTYSVKAAAAVSDVKLAVKYALWGNADQVRGVLVYVNGSLVNDGAAIYTPYTYKGTSGSADSRRWQLSGYLTGISLNAGDNQIRLCPAPANSAETFNGTAYTIDSSGALPNIDYLEVTGTGISAGSGSVSYYTLSYSADIPSFGAVSGTTAGNYASGTSVTVTAVPATGYTFDCWTGTVPSVSNSYTLSLSQDTTLVAHFIPSSYTAPSMYGYATVTDDSSTAYTVSGGAGGGTLTIDDLADLTTYASELSGDDPYIVTVSGTITTTGNVSTYVNLGSNKTVYGDTSNQGRFKNIELRIEGSNVIVRNMMFGEVIAYDTYGGTGNDALSLNGAQHVWIDHCTMQSHLTPQDNSGTVLSYSGSDEDWAKDFYDGLLDIKNGSSFVTVSNCYLHDHWKACLCGSSDSDENGDSVMRVTFYKNYWKDINARQPLFRYGKAHVVNNYFDEESSTTSSVASGINCRADSTLYIEQNYFANLKYCIGYYYDTSSTNTGYWNVKDNVFDKSANTAYDITTSTSKWVPAYTSAGTISAVAASSVPGSVSETTTGAGILTSADLQ